jgi:phosphopentomutase
MKPGKRVTILILDGMGVGELPDASRYGDEGSNTLGNLAAHLGGINLPHLESWGLGYIGDFKGIKTVADPLAFWGKMAERSPGKDTTTGHWELTGLILDKPFPTYPHGFPPALIEAFTRAIGRKILGNKPASGTEIIKELGPEHLKTGYPIVYTSADSVFQIAAHEEIIPPDLLYEYCRQARGLLQGEHGVGRVIARPFLGRPGNFYRTERRRDFSLVPPERTLLDRLQEHQIPVYGVGKLDDIFGGRGFTECRHVKNNAEGLNNIYQNLQNHPQGLIFANLGDFDTLYGHRNDPQGFYRALQEVDAFLPKLWGSLGEEELFIITADHGCDPTTPSTDHSREYVPLLVYSTRKKRGKSLGVRKTFADVGQTLAQYFKIEPLSAGESFLETIIGN